MVYTLSVCSSPLPTGVTVQLPEKPDRCQVRAHVIGCTVDLPARAMMQNIIQFNGFHGCSFCEQPGETESTEGGGHVHVYPFDTTTPDGPSREQQTLMNHANLSLEQDKPVSLCITPLTAIWDFCSPLCGRMKSAHMLYILLVWYAGSAIYVGMWSERTLMSGMPAVLQSCVGVLCGVYALCNGRRDEATVVSVD